MNVSLIYIYYNNNNTDYAVSYLKIIRYRLESPDIFHVLISFKSKLIRTFTGLNPNCNARSIPANTFFNNRPSLLVIFPYTFCRNVSKLMFNAFKPAR